MKHPDIIHNVSQSQLSIARYYGGITYNGVEYIYNPKDDTLTKMKPLRKRRKGTGAEEQERLL